MYKISDYLMVTVEEAKKLLCENIQHTGVIEVNILDSLNCVLASTIISPIDLPSFDQSSMDGYAINAGNDLDRKEFEVIGEIKAGDDSNITLKVGQAVRIFTGAKIPLHTDSIVVQEKVTEENGTLFLQEKIKIADCIRKKGTQIKCGQIALEVGSIMNPASIGFVASLGIGKVNIFSKPEVSIIVTGNEIVSLDDELTNAKVFESNSYTLTSALNQMGIRVKSTHLTEDDLEVLKHKINTCLINADIVLITGGISVGKYDFAYDAMLACGVETIFYKVLQKPGMPIFAGKFRRKLIFALPGNPASALVCFYQYVYPSIKQMQGFQNIYLPTAKCKSHKEINKKTGKAHFIRATLSDGFVTELDGQDSNMLRSFAQANGFIYLGKETEKVLPGEEVEFHFLPFNTI